MDFQPAVSIMSVAWLKTEALRTVTPFYKPNAQWRRAGKAEVLQKGSQILWDAVWMPGRVPTERSSNLGIQIKPDVGLLYSVPARPQLESCVRKTTLKLLMRNNKEEN